MKVHKRKTLADTYECSECNTMFRKEDLKRTYNKPGLGKYVFQPDVEECPFCYADLDLELAEIVEYPEPVARNKEIAGLIKNKYMLEKQIEEANCKRIRGEGVGMIDDDDQPHLEETGYMTKLRKRDNVAVTDRSNAQNVIIESLITLGQTQARLKAKRIFNVNGYIYGLMNDAPNPVHLPRTERQNCHSGGVTIRPQVNWKFWSDYIPTTGGFPFQIR